MHVRPWEKACQTGCILQEKSSSHLLFKCLPGQLDSQHSEVAGPLRRTKSGYSLVEHKRAT